MKWSVLVADGTEEVVVDVAVHFLAFGAELGLPVLGFLVVLGHLNIFNIIVLENTCKKQGRLEKPQIIMENIPVFKS